MSLTNMYNRGKDHLQKTATGVAAIKLADVAKDKVKSAAAAAVAPIAAKKVAPSDALVAPSDAVVGRGGNDMLSQCILNCIAAKNVYSRTGNKVSSAVDAVIGPRTGDTMIGPQLTTNRARHAAIKKVLIDISNMENLANYTVAKSFGDATKALGSKMLGAERVEHGMKGVRSAAENASAVKTAASAAASATAFVAKNAGKNAASATKNAALSTYNKLRGITSKTGGGRRRKQNHTKKRRKTKKRRNRPHKKRSRKHFK